MNLDDLIAKTGFGRAYEVLWNARQHIPESTNAHQILTDLLSCINTAEKELQPTIRINPCE